MQGQMEGELTQTGVAQAQALVRSARGPRRTLLPQTDNNSISGAVDPVRPVYLLRGRQGQRLSKVTFDVIYCSDLKRTRDTARRPGSAPLELHKQHACMASRTWICPCRHSPTSASCHNNCDGPLNGTGEGDLRCPRRHPPAAALHGRMPREGAPPPPAALPIPPPSPSCPFGFGSFSWDAPAQVLPTRRRIPRLAELCFRRLIHGASSSTHLRRRHPLSRVASSRGSPTGRPRPRHGRAGPRAENSERQGARAGRMSSPELRASSAGVRGAHTLSLISCAQQHVLPVAGNVCPAPVVTTSGWWQSTRWRENAEPTALRPPSLSCRTAATSRSS